MVDPDRARQLLDTLAGYCERLAALRDLSPQAYADQAFAGRYLVQASAQVSIDLANHVISSSGWRVPSDYADAFSVLAENDVLASELGGRMRDLARLRNLLVHAYGEVDDHRVQESLGAGLGDLDEFARAIASLLR